MGGGQYCWPGRTGSKELFSASPALYLVCTWLLRESSQSFCGSPFGLLALAQLPSWLFGFVGGPGEGEKRKLGGDGAEAASSTMLAGNHDVHSHPLDLTPRFIK